MPLTLSRSAPNRTIVSPIGLDVGPRHLRAAQLERRGPQWRVLRTMSWRRRDSEVGSDVVEGFSRRIKRSLEQAGFKGRRVVAGLSVPEIELHALDIPAGGDMQEEEKFADAVRWEMDRVGTTATSARTAFWHLPPSKATRTTAIGVQAPAKNVADVDYLIRSIGRDCERVDATSCAITRLGAALRRGGSADPREAWSVIDVGYRMLRLVLVIGEVPVLVRDLAMGAQRWTERIAESLGLSIDAAEIHKCDYGISADCADASRIASSEIATIIRDILRPNLDDAVGEVERSYDYVMRCYPESPAGGMLVVGGGAELNGLVDHLTERLGIHVQSLQQAVEQPGSSLTLAPSVRDRANPFACAIGLAIDAETSS